LDMGVLLDAPDESLHGFSGRHASSNASSEESADVTRIGRRRLPRRLLEMRVGLRRIAGIEKKPDVALAANIIQFASLKIADLQCLFAIRFQRPVQYLGSEHR